MNGTSIKPAQGPHVWHGSDYAGRDDWIYRFSPAALDDIARAVAGVRERGLALDDITTADFDLPALTRELAQMDDILRRGRGFVLLKGLPVERYSDDEMAIILWGIGTHLGIGVSQSHLGDRIGHVIDKGETLRYYTAGGPIEVHMDPVDVTGLLCLREARRGGASFVMSSFLIHNIIAEERPDLLEVLRRGYFYGAQTAQPGQSGQPITATPNRIPVYTEIEGYPDCFFLPLAIRMVADMAGKPLGEAEREAVDYLQQVAERPGVAMEMDIHPGDIQFLNNRLLLHARQDYEDWPEWERKRHLLRLWLMMPDWPERPEHLRMIRTSDRAGGGVPKSDPPLQAGLR